MAKGRRVVADQNSEEIDQLRRALHSLLLILENAGNLGGAATTTAAQTFQAIADAISTGVDADNAPYVGTGLSLAGVIPTPKHPKRASVGTVEDLDPKDL